MIAAVKRALVLACVLVAACDATAAVRDGGLEAADGGTSDAARADGTLGDASADPDASAVSDAGIGPPEGPVLYPADRRHSPITFELAEGLRDLSARDATLAEDVFMKVGDSITVSSTFLHCFAGSSVELDGRSLSGTLERFRAGDAGGTSPYRRASLSATVGWSAFAAISGDPTPLAREHDALAPRFAVVMFGTNDVGYRTTEAFARDMWTITDTLRARGTVPLLSTIPPRDDSPAADARVPMYNLALRALAQGRAVPLVDYHRELGPLPSHGLAGDGVHPQVYGSGGCVLTTDGLRFGANVRNLITLEQLDRAARALSGEVLDADAPRLRGSGAPEDPFEIEILPFAAMGETAGSPHRTIDRYGCSDVDESGPERVYRLELAAPARITASVVSARGADVDVHLLAGSVSAGACLARDNRELTMSVGAGTYYVVADTWVDPDGVEHGGEFLLLVSVD